MQSMLDSLLLLHSFFSPTVKDFKIETFSGEAGFESRPRAPLHAPHSLPPQRGELSASLPSRYMNHWPRVQNNHTQKAEEMPCVVGQGLILTWPLSVPASLPSLDPSVLVHPLSWPVVCRDFPFGALLSLIPGFSGRFCQCYAPSPGPPKARLQTHNLQLSRAPDSWDGLSISFWSSSSLSSKSIPEGSAHPRPLLRGLLIANGPRPSPSTLIFLSCFLEL